jgi:hypothetical protein
MESGGEVPCSEPSRFLLEGCKNKGMFSMRNYLAKSVIGQNFVAARRSVRAALD